MMMIASVAALLWWGRDQVMYGDDLFYATRLSHHSLPHAILYSNVYLIAAPLVLYRAMFEILGIGSYFPYRVVAVALALLCALVFYDLARQRIGSWWALVPTVSLLFFGSAWDVLITGARFPELIAVGSGLGAMILIERGNRYRDALAAGLLCVSVTSHLIGLAFVTAGAVMVAMRPSPKRWTSSWIVILPACLFGIWYLFFRVDLGRGPTDIFDVISFSFSSWTMLIAALSGLSKPLSDPVYEQPLAKLVVGLSSSSSLPSLRFAFAPEANLLGRCGWTLLPVC